MFKLSKLFKLLLSGFIMHAMEESGGGADTAAADAAAEAAEAEARGDILSAAGPDTKAAIADPLADAKKAHGEKTVEAGEAGADDETQDEDDADKTDGKDKNARIPLARHKAILEKERAERAKLQEQLAQFQNGAVVADINADISKAEEKVTAMEEEYNKLLAEGEIAKATAKMTEIRRAERAIGEQKAAMSEAALESRLLERARWDKTVARLEAAYPQLDKDHDAYDEALVTRILKVQRGLAAQGDSPVAALQEAVELVIGAETSKQKSAVSVKPKVSTEDADAQKKKDTLAEQRAKEARARNVETAKNSPASMETVGANSDNKGGVLDAKVVLGMSQKEFAKLSEADLARMRGDTL